MPNDDGRPLDGWRPASGVVQGMTEFPVLQTQRLALTRIVADDRDALFAMFSDPRVVEYYDLEPMSQPGDAQPLIELFDSRYAAAAGIRWAIRERGAGPLLGTCGFNSWNRRMRNATLGYDLAQPHWGKGYVTEALAAVIGAAFAGTLACGRLHRVQADTIVGNAASERVLGKLGFREEGVRRQAAFIRGAYRDMKCFGLEAGPEP